jgi:uncharacterized membrane protein/glutaredoxin
MIRVTLYSRKDCHLCDQAKSELDSLQQEIPHQLTVVDIDQDAAARRKYNDQIPVLVAGPYTLRAPFDAQDLKITLGAAQHRERQIAEIDEAVITTSGPSSLVWTKADAFSYWLSRRYLYILNIIVLIYFGLPFLAPVFMRAGAVAPAAVIYRMYSLTCHQLAFRSWFLFGEQAAYPRQSAGVDNLAAYEAVTGFDGEDLVTGRNFIGNESLGYKVALCERDIAIYGAIFAFGLIFALVGGTIPALPWYLWVLVGLVPIGLDGVSQLISQPPLQLLPYRESTPFLRTLTGALFGFSTAWFGYPIVEETMAETRQFLGRKLERLKRHSGQNHQI